jgi:hypothetical protein
MAVGVFGLQTAYKLKRTELLSTDDTHGWFGGSPFVYRIDFSNDSATALARGGLTVSVSKMAATGNSNYGWFGGGYFGPSSFGGTPTSTVDRIDFSNDSVTASPRGPLTRERRNLAATGNSNYGWFGGGYTSLTPNGPQSRVDRIDFSNDSSLSVRGNLSLARYSLAATGNSNYGWFGAGMVGGVYPSAIAGPAHSTVQRIDFSNDNALTSVRGPLSIPLSASGYYQWAATGNSNYGWFAGGHTSSVARIDFANDSEISLTRGSLSSVRTFLVATGNSNYGWFAGGYTSSVARIDFANDSSTASLRGAVPSQNSATSGQAKGPAIKLQKAGNFGWFGGGYAPGSRSTVDRINFSNDSVTASARGPLSSVRYYVAATGNSNYGWFGGGSPALRSTVDRIDFSNDSATASVRGPLSLARREIAATGNSNYGWFGGGQGGGSPTLVSTVDRIDFSNDSATASPRGPLSAVRQSLAATGNSNYGWFGGGYQVTSIVQRINFSNDSATASPRGILSMSRYHLAATGNSNYGWFGGGFAPGISAVDRIDFSNDSARASVRGPLSSARYYLAATGNSNYGWFGGGQLFVSPSDVLRSTVDRIDFSNDSVSASPRGSLFSVKEYLAATSNTPI